MLDVYCYGTIVMNHVEEIKQSLLQSIFNKIINKYTKKVVKYCCFDLMK